MNITELYSGFSGKLVKHSDTVIKLLLYSERQIYKKYTKFSNFAKILLIYYVFCFIRSFYGYSTIPRIYESCVRGIL